MKKIYSAVLASAVFMTLILQDVPAFARTSYALKLSRGGTSVYYDRFDEGWAAALDIAKTEDPVITLGRNWLAGDTNNNGITDESETTGDFSYYINGAECGTKDGSLLVNGSVKLTIDLNGFTISRGCAAEKDSGQVFTVTEGAMLTVTDTSQNADGMVTGGKNSGYGGAFCVESRATLTLNGGKISGNYARYGGGVYICNGMFYMNGGSVEKNSAEYGGGICYDKKFTADREYIVCRNGKIKENSARVGGGVDLDSARDDMVATFDNMEISNNFASGVGGGVYIGFTDENGVASFCNGTVITKNVADVGGGVYASCGGYSITDTRITDNRAFTRCGGVGVDDDMDDNSHGNSWEYGIYTLGGSVYIKDNYVQPEETNAAKVPSNLRIGDNTCDLYYDASNPFTENTAIGIDMYTDFGRQENEEKLTDAKGNFAIDSYKYFTSDNPAYIIAARDGGSGAGANRYQIYTEMAEDAMDGGIKGATLKPAFRSEVTPVADEQNKTVTFTVNPKMKRSLANSSLYNFADFSLGSDGVSVSDGNKVTDLLDEAACVRQVLTKNNDYELWYIKIVPFGGQWSDEDESAARVTYDGVTKYYADFESAWADAIQASVQKDTLFVMNKDWYAGDADADGNIDPGETKGVFKVEKDGSECGTNKGRLYLNDNIRLTIDLNGHTLSRNLTGAVDDGQVFSLQDQDIVLTIKDSKGGGKITGGNNKGNGGAFFVYNGNLNIEGGEISGNKANNGAGIYWDSRNKLCAYGGRICSNAANSKGGGIYGTDWGDMYFGGTIVVSGNTGASNSTNNLYLEDDDVCVNHTAGQTEGVPNVPFKDGASIGISMAETNDTVLISGKNSSFDSNNFAYFFGDNSGYFVRAVFDERGEGNTHKLYYNKWSYKDAVYPKIKTVAVRENNGLISEASIDVDKQIITLKAISSDKSLFNSVIVEKLVSFTTSNDADVYWRFCDMAFDLTIPFEYKVVSKSTGTYVQCRVVVEFPECEHIDVNDDNICDDCGKSVLTCVKDYNAQTKTATVFAAKAGKYTLIFADYENGRLANINFADCNFNNGVNEVSDIFADYLPGKGDKIMLWHDMACLVPACNAFELK